MGFFSRKERTAGPSWVELNDKNQLIELSETSFNKAVLIYKHSTRCSISVMAKNRLESKWDISEEEIIPVYLDLLTYRDISNEVESRFGIQHESPQLLLIKEGQCVYSASHSQISVRSLKENL
jgi:bacillithiol system protein YtxJ